MAPAKQNGNMTPGRRGIRGTNNQYFEPGKVGRKTGITLRDTGVRDEHGMEPLSGIFSSSPIASVEQADGYAIASDNMDVQESSAPDVTTTLGLRKTPRLPPARQSTPKHTNIGSPKRMSSARPATRAVSIGSEDDVSPSNSRTSYPANRVLDFAGAANRGRKSLHVVEDTHSPFKPKKALRRSQGPTRPDPFDIQRIPISQAHAPTTQHEESVADGRDDTAQPLEDGAAEWDDAPALGGDDNFYEAYESPVEGDGDEQHDDQASASAKSGQKRARSSLQSTHGRNVSDTIQEEEAEPAQKKRRGRPSSGKEKVIVHTQDGPETIDPSLIAYGDSYIVENDNGEGPSVSQAEATSKPKKRGRPNASKAKTRAPAPKAASPVKVYQRGGSVGPISNVNLRATTPFEDANQRSSRYGRNLIKPLQYWANETRIYRNGDIEGIVRADPVEVIKEKANKKKKKSKRNTKRLDDIEEVSDTESVLADSWEDEQGVLTYTLANYNPETGLGDPDDPIEEDIAFAQSSIVTRDVVNSNFRYAKIMTIPFFGAGLVELPPNGFKRAKNSRKMQMAFFVHEGKVTVDVGGGEGLEVNQFSLSKGGVWIVPRGNNYSISNPSATRTAKVFFAQGCEVDGSVPPA